MSIRFDAVEKRTIVRIFILGVAVSLAAGCSATPRQAAGAESCPPTRTAVCDSFGPQNRCRCSETSRVDRQLERFGHAALAGRAW